jgi:hypothetical protein
MLTQPNPISPAACSRTLAAIAAATLFIAMTSPSVQAQQPAPQNVPTPPDSAKPKAAPPEAKPIGDPKTGVLKPPDVDPKMAKTVPDVDPAMDNPPPGTTKAPADAPPAEAKPR